LRIARSEPSALSIDGFQLPLVKPDGPVSKFDVILIQIAGQVRMRNHAYDGTLFHVVRLDQARPPDTLSDVKFQHGGAERTSPLRLKNIRSFS
jgi:hypothetical protein